MSYDKDNDMPWERMLKEMQDGTHAGDMPQLPPDKITTQQLFMLLVAQNQRIVILTNQVASMAQAQKEHIQAQKDMLETWRTAGNLLKFIKLVGAFGTSVAALWAGIKIMAHYMKNGGGPT